NFLNDVHRVGNMTRRRRLLASCVGNVLNQVRQALRYVFDLFQSHTGILGQTGTAYYFRGGVLHGDHRFVGVGLNRLHQGLDLFGCGRGTFSQTLNFVRNHREAAARVTGHGGLDRGVERQNVGLVGNVVNQRYDVTNLLGRLTQTLDPLGGLLDLLTDGIHAVDGVLYHFGAFLGDGYRALRNRGGFRSVGGYLVDGHGHFVDRRGSSGDFLGLVLGSIRQVHGGGLGFLGGARYPDSRFVDRRYQPAHLVDREVDGVGDGAGEVLGYRGFGGQVTVREVGQFVQQTQNRILVLFVLGSFLLVAQLGFFLQGIADAEDGEEDQGQQDIGQIVVNQAAVGLVLVEAYQVGGFTQQALGVLENVVGGFTHPEQFGRFFQDGIDVGVDELEQLGNGFQAVAGVFVVHAADAHDRVAVHHAVQHATEQVGVAAEAVGGSDCVCSPFQYLAHTTHDPLSQQRLALGYGDLVGGSPVFQKDGNNVLVFHLQLGDLFV